MDDFALTFDVRWSDVDANRHVRHSAYADYAAHVRIRLLQAAGMGIEILAQHHLGPVLFREETVFRREISLSDSVTVDAKLQKVREDGSRWTFIQHIVRADGETSAIVTVDGAWLNLEKRKLCALPEDILAIFINIPRSHDFSFI